jgi:SsrA-binding protein
MAGKITNRYARHEYEISEPTEAGLVLVGDEIKAVRASRVNLKGSYVKIFYNEGKAEAFLVGAHFHTISADPYRTRKLLLHKNEIDRLMGKINEKGLTVVPLSLYIKNGKAKLEIALGKGKKLYDKRATIRERELNIRARRILGNQK